MLAGILEALVQSTTACVGTEGRRRLLTLAGAPDCSPSDPPTEPEVERKGHLRYFRLESHTEAVHAGAMDISNKPSLLVDLRPGDYVFTCEGPTVTACRVYISGDVRFNVWIEGKERRIFVRPVTE